MGCHSYTVFASVVCPLLRVAESVGLDVSIVIYCLASFSLVALLSLALQGALQDNFYNGVVSSGVAKPGELASFHCCQQSLLKHFVSNACMRLSVSAVSVQLSHP